MRKKSTKNIRIAFLLNLGFAIIELVGGFYTNSIAIIADALHDFSDSLSIAISWFLEKKSEKKPNKKYTYGYGRFSVLGALISTLVLLISSITIIFIAIPRIMNPAEIHYDGVLVLAILGVIINGFAVYKTAKGKSLNEKAINLHLLEDVFGWAAVLITSIIMRIFDIPLLDPLLSILITIYILFRVIANLKEVFEVFLEKAPSNIDLEELKSHLLNNENIEDVHHLHLWTLDGVNKYIMLHITINDSTTTALIIDIKKYVKEELRTYGINHSSIEIEFESENCSEYECVPDAHYDNHFGHNH